MPLSKPTHIPKLSKESYGLLLLLLSAMLYSVMGIFVKLVSAAGIPATQLVFFRAVFQLSFVLAGLVVFREKKDDNGNDNDKSSVALPPRLILAPFGRSRPIVRVVLARGAIGGFGFVLYYFTIKSIPLGDAISLLSLTPIVTVFLARFALGEPIRPAQLLATVLSTVGAVLIAGGPKHMLGLFSKSTTATITVGPYYNPVGYVTALIGSFTSSCVLVLVRKAGTLGVHTLRLLLSWCLFGLTFSCLLGLLNDHNEQVAALFHEEPWHLPSDPAVWWNMLGVCGVGSVAHFLLNYAGRFAPAGLSSIVRSSSIMWGYLFEVTVFHQNPKAITWLGVTIVLFSLVLVAWEKVAVYWDKQYNQQHDAAFLVATTNGGDGKIQDEDEELTVGLKSKQSYGSFGFLGQIA